MELHNIDEWYFAYSYKHIGTLPEDQWEAFGGSPGFAVHKSSGEIRDLSWKEFNRINNEK